MAPSDAAQLQSFLSDLAVKRSRLAELLCGDASEVDAMELADEMTGLGEALIAAEDELRAQAVPGTEAERADAAATPHALALEALARMAQAELSAPPDRERDAQNALQAAVVRALDMVPEAERAGAAVIDGMSVRTLVATDHVVQMCDTLQSDLGEGPSLHAQENGEALHVADLSADPRWPRLPVAAGQLGIRSVLVCSWPLSRHRRGALSLYAERPGAFGEVAPLVAPALACRVRIVMHHADRVHNLQVALGSRQVIGQATGVLMERYKIGADAAFQMLVDGSQRAHVKLRELAVRVTETGEDPRDLAPQEQVRARRTADQPSQRG